MSLIEAHKTRWDWKTILNVPLNVPLNEPHRTTWRGLISILSGVLKMHHQYVLATIIIKLIISLFSWYFIFNIIMFMSSLYILSNFSPSFMVVHHLFTISFAIIEGWKCLASPGWEYPSGERRHFQNAYFYLQSKQSKATKSLNRYAFQTNKLSSSINF